jgi:hypothetical protein
MTEEAKKNGKSEIITGENRRLYPVYGLCIGASGGVWTRDLPLSRGIYEAAAICCSNLR